MNLSLFNMNNNKKAQSHAVIFTVVVVLLMFGIVSIFGMYLTTEYINAFNQTGFYTGKAVEAGEGFLFTHRLFDYIIVLFLFTMWIGLAISSYRVATPAVYFIIMLLAGGFYGLVSFFFNYYFQEFAGQAIFTSIMVYFPRTVLICKNLHWITLGSIVIGSIALYGKKPKGQFLS